MKQLRQSVLAILSLVMMMAVVESGFAQSQYRRDNGSKQGNSVYGPENGNKSSHNNKSARPQERPQSQAPAARPQPQAPASRPQQSQYRKPAQGQPSQQRPQQPAVGKPQQPSHSARPQQRPSMPKPPANHYRPKPDRFPSFMSPRPSVHFYGYYVNTLPLGAKIIHRGPYDYYYVDGRYYRYIDNVYVISRPPVGAVIARAVLDGLVRLTNYVVRDAYGKSQRYYTDDDGVYYIKSGSNYVVVDPPVGAVVYELPYGFVEVIINGAKYYRVDDNYYELIYNGPNDYYFKVVGTLNR